MPSRGLLRDYEHSDGIFSSTILITQQSNTLEYFPTSPFLVSSDYNIDRGNTEHQVTVHDVDDQESLESRLSLHPPHNAATDSEQSRSVLATALQQLLSRHGDLLSATGDSATATSCHGNLCHGDLLSGSHTGAGNDAGKIIICH